MAGLSARGDEAETADDDAAEDRPPLARHGCQIPDPLEQRDARHQRDARRCGDRGERDDVDAELDQGRRQRRMDQRLRSRQHGSRHHAGEDRADQDGRERGQRIGAEDRSEGVEGQVAGSRAPAIAPSRCS